MTKRYIIMFIVYTAIMAAVYTLIFNQQFGVAFVKSIIAGALFVLLYHLLVRWLAKRQKDA
ncbi:hypothetical protein EOD41_17490 [Mucilaginibacter limnophilus]|uniref:Uncharacterized protein n=1 Tax=Mucilaginibacter limnophilus TaxID=1932778 RepID=A0A437MKP6_9SPHI|nr:hypothetical protein [Mucilaginibacter limnophilus]RVT98165.1 hypothetical protein EOD41_17490 [Mucilaginibacter limnophilus]